MSDLPLAVTAKTTLCLPSAINFVHPTKAVGQPCVTWLNLLRPVHLANETRTPAIFIGVRRHDSDQLTDSRGVARLFDCGN